jgi:hypothetical protein
VPGVHIVRPAVGRRGLRTQDVAALGAEGELERRVLRDATPLVCAIMHSYMTLTQEAERAQFRQISAAPVAQRGAQPAVLECAAVSRARPAVPYAAIRRAHRSTSRWCNGTASGGVADIAVECFGLPDPGDLQACSPRRLRVRRSVWLLGPGHRRSGLAPCGQLFCFGIRYRK